MIAQVRVLIAGGCCCAVGAGAWYYWPSPNPNPTPNTIPITVPTSTTAATIPPPTTSNTEPNVYSANAAGQLPTIPGDITVDGTDALNYVGYLRTAIPGTNWYFTIADQVVSCAMTDGLLAARAYFGGVTTATVVIVLAASSGYTLTQAIVDCATRRLHPANGGPTVFQPCADAYYYDAGSVRYFVFVASTQSLCSSVKAAHQQNYVTKEIWPSG